MVASAINSAHLIAGIEGAGRALDLEGEWPKRSIRFETACVLFDKLRAPGTLLQLQKLTKDEESLVWSGDQDGSLRRLVRNRRDVFLVLLESQYSVHTVAVDTRPLLRIIVNSLEPYAVSLCVRNLKFCGGGLGTHIRAVRRVVLAD